MLRNLLSLVVFISFGVLYLVNASIRPPIFSAGLVLVGGATVPGGFLITPIKAPINQNSAQTQSQLKMKRSQAYVSAVTLRGGVILPTLPPGHAQTSKSEEEKNPVDPIEPLHAAASPPCPPESICSEEEDLPLDEEPHHHKPHSHAPEFGKHHTPARLNRKEE